MFRMSYLPSCVYLSCNHFEYSGRKHHERGKEGVSVFCITMYPVCLVFQYLIIQFYPFKLLLSDLGILLLSPPHLLARAPEIVVLHGSI